MKIPIKFTQCTPEEVKEFRILYEKALELIQQDSVGKQLLQIAKIGPHFKPDMSKDAVININLKTGQAGLVYRDEMGDHCCLGPRGCRNTIFLNFENPNNQDLTKTNQIDITDQVSSSEKIGRLADIFFHELVHVQQYNQNKNLIADKRNQKFPLPVPLLDSIIEADARTQAALFSWRRSKNTDLIHYQCYYHKFYGLSREQWDIFANKIKQSKNPEEIQDSARYLFSSLLESVYQFHSKEKSKINAPKFNSEKAVSFLARIYMPQTYGSPQEFAACIPDLSVSNQVKLQNLIKMNRNKVYSSQRE